MHQYVPKIADSPSPAASVLYPRSVEQTWLPNHEIEASTRQSYTYVLRVRILPEFGEMRMMDILPEHVREWVACMKAGGVSPPTIRYAMVVLGAIFTTALNDQVTSLHPCRGVKTHRSRPSRAPSSRRSSSRSWMTACPTRCPSCWWRPRSRAACAGGADRVARARHRVRHPDADGQPGGRPGGSQVPSGGQPVPREALPKDKEYRRFKLSTQITAKLRAHVTEHELQRDDLLFEMPVEERPRVRAPRLDADLDALGRTEPNAAGRRYRHGTLTGYSLGSCRCDYCRDAYCRYRAERRANGKDDPRGLRACDTDGHIPSGWFRESVWRPALKKADLMIHVRIHDLRHAHASWLLAGGADLQVVKQRLGHGSLRTTEKYLHTLPDADETALEALSKMRNRGFAI